MQNCSLKPFSTFNIQLFPNVFWTRKSIIGAPVEPQHSLGLGATNAQINFQKRVTKDGRRVFSGNQHPAANCIVRDERVWRRWILDISSCSGVGKGENDAVIKLNLLSNSKICQRLITTFFISDIFLPALRESPCQEWTERLDT